MIDVVMEMKFSISKYSQVFYRLGSEYGGLTKYIILDQYVGFPGEEYNFSLLMLNFIQLAVHQHCIEFCIVLYLFSFVFCYIVTFGQVIQ
jgi:hypothetical protein